MFPPQKYNRFTLSDIDNLGVQVVRQKFLEQQKLPVSEWLQQTLSINMKMPIGTEKAASEFIVLPVLNEWAEKNPDRFTLFSGYELNVAKSKGLSGRCDYLIAGKPQLLHIQAPLCCVVEAKLGAVTDNNNIAQCIAEMYAAQLFNEQKQTPMSAVHGIVTSGFDWLFMRLQQQKVEQHPNIYSIAQLSELLGALQQIIDYYPPLR